MDRPWWQGRRVGCRACDAVFDVEMGSRSVDEIVALLPGSPVPIARRLGGVMDLPVPGTWPSDDAEGGA